MKLRAATVLTLSVLVATAGCLSTDDDPGGEGTPPAPGTDPVIAVDAATYAQVEDAVEQVVEDAFGAAEAATRGQLETSSAVLVSCSMRGDHVGKFSVRGTLISTKRESAATVDEVAKRIEAAWSELGLEPARGEDGAVTGLRVERDVRIGLSVDPPVVLTDGSGRTVRSVGLSSACLDLGVDLWQKRSNTRDW